MTITAAQREARKGWIGASDVPVIVGLSPHRNVTDLWAEKTGRVEGVEESDDMRLGTFLEPFVLMEAERSLGPLIRPRKTVHLPELHLAANLDAATRKGRIPVEAKTHALRSGIVSREWGDAGTDDVPGYVYAQVHAQMMCCGVDVAHVAALIPGRGSVVSLYVIERDKSVCDTIAECAAMFWRCVETDTRPLPIQSIWTAKRLRRMPASVVTITQDLVDDWRRAKDFAKVANEAKSFAEARLLAALGDAEAAEWGTGERITYLEQHRSGYAVEETTYRVLRLKGQENGRRNKRIGNGAAGEPAHQLGAEVLDRTGAPQLCAPEHGDKGHPELHPEQ